MQCNEEGLDEEGEFAVQCSEGSAVQCSSVQCRGERREARVERGEWRGRGERERGEGKEKREEEWSRVTSLQCSAMKRAV